MDKIKRSLRRHHYYRQKRNRRNNYNVRYNNMHVNTPCLCSCPMCSRPRSNTEITMQERRNRALYNEELLFFNVQVVNYGINSYLQRTM